MCAPHDGVIVGMMCGRSPLQAIAGCTARRLHNCLHRAGVRQAGCALEAVHESCSGCAPTAAAMACRGTSCARWTTGRSRLLCPGPNAPRSFARVVQPTRAMARWSGVIQCAVSAGNRPGDVSRDDRQGDSALGADGGQCQGTVQGSCLHAATAAERIADPLERDQHRGDAWRHAAACIGGRTRRGLTPMDAIALSGGLAGWSALGGVVVPAAADDATCPLCVACRGTALRSAGAGDWPQPQ